MIKVGSKTHRFQKSELIHRRWYRFSTIESVKKFYKANYRLPLTKQLTQSERLPNTKC